jgi:hypothetical protein
MPQHVDWEICVHLDHGASNEVGHKDDYFKAIQDRYASKYCDMLGVEPHPHHKNMITKLAPLGECKIEAQWLDSAGLASSLSIVQPNIGGEDEKMEGVSLSHARRKAEWFGRASYASVLPPDPPREIAASFDLACQSKAKALAAKQHLQARSLGAMQLQDLANSQKQEHGLTDELERTRLRIRSDLEDASGKADVFGRLLKKKGKRDDAEQELESLRVKFLLPFACEREGSENLLPWQSPELRTCPQIDVHEDFLDDAKKPIRLTIPQIEEETFNYAVMSFPVELLTTRSDVELFAAVKESLVTPEAVRLIGLLAHFLYWIVLEHIHEPAKRLPGDSKQSLALTIQDLFAQMQAPARQRLGRRGELLSKDGPAGISFVIPAFVLALKRGVEWCFKASHPWIFEDARTNTQLIDQINILFMRLFDPDCLYASFGALEASERAIKLWHKLSVLQASLGVTPARRIIHQEFRTTPLMSLLMNSDGCEPGDPKTRVLLAKSPSEGMISSSANERIPLDGWRRDALYKSANKRIAGLARQNGSPTEKAKGGFMKRTKSNTLLRSSKSRSGTHTRSSEKTFSRASTVGSDSHHSTIHTVPSHARF